MSNIDKPETELLIENGMLVADTLRHLADNEIDSDRFAICQTNENGTEIECELAITDYARQAAGTVEDLVKTLEAAERRIANNERVMRAVVEAASIRGIRPFEGIECDPPTLEENAEACGDAMSARIRELEANPPKPHHNGLMQISNELVQARQRIAELEKGHQEAAKQINSWRRLAKQNIAERGKDISELEAARQRIAEQSAIVAAAEKLVRCKGRYHSELNYRALAKLFGVVTPDLPPLEHENVHYADAAEVEITALRQRIQELEAKLSKPVLLPKTNGYWTEQEKAYEEAITLAKRQVRLAGFNVEGM